MQDAVVETNGTVSVLTKAEYGSVTPKQLKLEVEENSTAVAVVIDGKPVDEYFGQNKIKKSEIELLVTDSGKRMEDILLLTIDDCGKVNMIEKRGK